MPMPSFPMPRRRLLAAIVALAAAASAPAAAAPPRPQLVGRTLDGKPFNLLGQRGKVVLVVFWSTACAVCRDTLPELRRNYAGWAGKPFELVIVSTDTHRQDVLDYDRLVEQIVPMSERFPALWRAEPGHDDGFGAPGLLPATFVIDREGRIAERFNGRVPPEAWDRVAELLP